MKNKKKYIALISAVLLGIAQHYSSLGFIVWFSLIPFLYLIHTLKSYKEIIKYTFFWGVLYHFTTMFWLSSNVGTDKISAIVSMIATILYLSTNTILIGVVWYRLKSFFPKYSIFLLAIVWTSIEFIKSYGLLAFPWVSIANTQIDYFYFEMANFDKLNELYNLLDLYIVSSRIEGGPQAIVECGITKTPIISTNVGFTSDILSEESIYDMNNFKKARPNVEYAYNKSLDLIIPNGFEKFTNMLFSNI